jgi:deoxyadenosine/deoxycytidine kinase
MNGDDQTAFCKQLDDFSHRLEARTREFEEKGEFSDTHEALLQQIHLRRDQLRAKVNAAIRQGTLWQIVRAEFARDYDSLFDDFLQLEERLNAEAMRKKSSPGR